MIRRKRYWWRYDLFWLFFALTWYTATIHWINEKERNVSNKQIKLNIFLFLFILFKTELGWGGYMHITPALRSKGKRISSSKQA